MRCWRHPDYDGLAIRSATKVTPKIIAAAPRLKVIAARHRRRQCRYPGRHQPAHRGDEHALRQCHHHGRARHLDDDGAGPPDSRSQCLHPCRQVGEEPLHGVELFNKTLGVIGLRQHRLDRGRPRPGLRMKVIAYDPFLSPERAVEIASRRLSSTRSSAVPTSSRCIRRSPRQDPQHRRRGSPRENARRACASSIARAAGWWPRTRSMTP